MCGRRAARGVDERRVARDEQARRMLGNARASAPHVLVVEERHCGRVLTPKMWRKIDVRAYFLPHVVLLE